MQYTFTIISVVVALLFGALDNTLEARIGQNPPHNICSTVTPTPTISATPTPTVSSTPGENAMLFFYGAESAVVSTFNHAELSSTLANAEVVLPMNARLSNMFVTCRTAQAAGFHNFTIDKAGTPDTTLQCGIMSNANCIGSTNPAPCCTGAGTGTCSTTTCSDTTGTVDIAGGGTPDRLSLAVTSVAGATSTNCFTTVAVTNQDNTSYDSLVTFGNSANTLSPANATYCVPGVNTNQSGCIDGNGTAIAAAFVFPNACQLSGIGIALNSTVGAGRSETYTLTDLTAAADTSMTVTLNTGDQQKTATGSWETTVPLTHQYAMRFNRTGAAESKFRQLSFTCAGIGTMFLANATSGSSTLVNNPGFFSNRQGSVANTVSVRLPVAGTIRRLVAALDSPDASTLTATACDASSSPPVCTGTRPSCSFVYPATSCSDVADAHARALAQGDYLQFQLGLDLPLNSIRSGSFVMEIDP